MQHVYIFDKRLISIIIIYVSVTNIVINLGVVRSDEKMEEEDQELAQIQQQQHQDAIKQHQKANSKDLQIKLEQEHQDAIRQQQEHQEAIRQQQCQNAIRQQQEEAKATQIQREQQHQDAIEQQERQEAIRQQQEEAKATQIQHDQQRQDAIEQQRQETQQDAIEQKRQEMQRASQNFQDAVIEQKRQETQRASWLSVRSPKAKNMEDRLSPKAQDLVKKSAKVKSASNDLVVEKRKERKRALESKSRKKGFVEGLRVDTEAQQQRAPSADLHAREMDTIDEIEADLLREVQEVQYNFPSPTSLEDGV